MSRQTIIILCVLAWVPTAVAMAIPPLTDEQSVRLETAYDGRDHQEEAFVSLIENLRAWDGAVSDTPIRLEPDVDAMLADPEQFRGEVVRLIGRVAQVTPLAAPHDGVLECFIRDEMNRPVLVYIVLPTDDEAAFSVRERSRIEVFARFYKRVDLTSRDRRVRSYAAFVGAHPRTVSPVAANEEVAYLTIISIALLALLIVFVLLMAAARRRRENHYLASARLFTESIPPELDDTSDLPDDPAEALSELRRRMHHADH